MRTSRLLFAGVGIAAAVAGTSAFTAGNTFSNTTNIAGYANDTATGATVTNIAYTPHAADPKILDTVVFTSSTQAIEGHHATMTLRDSTHTDAVVGSPYACTIGTWDSVTSTITITCDTSTAAPLIASFDGVGLTVNQ